MSLHHRQGDLSFVRLDTRPAVDLTARPSDSIVASEATGHVLRLQSGSILEAPAGALSLDSTQTTQVMHEEHGPLTQARGLWLVVRQRGYPPEAIRAVVD